MKIRRHFGLLFCMFACLLNAGESPAGDEKEEAREPATIAETITVTAELAPVRIKQATAKVSVIDQNQIEESLVNDIRDLVRYEPGVYVANDGTRLGLNGFNIRGIGGNRVLTRIDGVSSAEEFSFGPLAIHQQSIDTDLLKSVEILRGASSSLYGSDALGGVVSLATKDPVDFLRQWGRDRGFMVKTGYDTENNGSSLGLTGAMTAGAFEFSLSASQREYEALDNMGVVDAFDRTRTAPNDLDGSSTQLQARVVRNFGEHNHLRFTIENYDNQVDTQLYTGQGSSTLFGVTTDVSDYRADDSSNRLKLGLDQRIDGLDMSWLDMVYWQVHMLSSETEQDTTQVRESATPGGLTRIQRTGGMDFEQDSLGFELVLGKFFSTENSNYRLTYGLALDQAEFGQIRDRRDLDLNTGNPDAYRGSLVFPTRYFPKSDVDEYGGFVQLEANFFDDRLRLTPGLRYDRYKLTPDANDTIYLESTGTTTPPEGLDDDATSAKLGVLVVITDNLAWTGHYAEGFRAPPYSSVNSGFTNVAGGYQSLPNPDLKPEESVSLETGFKVYGSKGSLNVTWFDNDFEDFIADTQFVGVSDTGLSLFQAQNLSDVTISGLELAGDFLFNEHWSARFAYASIEGEDKLTGTPVESIEPDKGVLGLAWKLDRKLGGELTATHMAGRNQSDTATEDPFLPDATTLLDLTVYYQLNSHFKVFAGAFNLTDETWYPWSAVRGRNANDPTVERYSAPGRNLSVNIRYQW